MTGVDPATSALEQARIHARSNGMEHRTVFQEGAHSWWSLARGAPTLLAPACPTSPTPFVLEARIHARTKGIALRRGAFLFRPFCIRLRTSTFPPVGLPLLRCRRLCMLALPLPLLFLLTRPW
jgi:hypothetical protein